MPNIGLERNEEIRMATDRVNITRRTLLSGLAVATAAVALSHEVAIGEPSGASGCDGWKFKLGDLVTHKDQPLPSLVMGRVRTTKGREVYSLRSFAIVDPIRDRMILGDSLVAMGDDHPDWNVCPLAGTPFDLRAA